MAKRYKNILEVIGNTPLVRLNDIAKDLKPRVYAKLESFNPGDSTKDRIAKYIIEKAEREGRIQPGGTVIEASSGNTGYSVALTCRVKGYSCIVTVPDKASKEKVSMLQAMGAKVYVCPSDVLPDDPTSYYAKAKSLERRIKNSLYVNQYFNGDNTESHYYSTGPEIWTQTGGRITHFVACSGTGGTISGTAAYLKERNPNVQVIGVDACGSALKKYHETLEFDIDEIFPYTIEGVGKNMIPGTTRFELIDRFVKVKDSDAVFRTRELPLKEGIMAGYSSGAAMQGVIQIAADLPEDDWLVVLFPDHGSRYMSKVFNDEWVRAQHFYEEINGREVEVAFEELNFVKRAREFL